MSLLLYEFCSRGRSFGGAGGIEKTPALKELRSVPSETLIYLKSGIDTAESRAYLPDGRGLGSCSSALERF